MLFSSCGRGVRLAVVPLRTQQQQLHSYQYRTHVPRLNRVTDMQKHAAHALPTNEADAPSAPSPNSPHTGAPDPSAAAVAPRAAVAAGLVIVALGALVLSGGTSGLRDRVQDLEELIASSGAVGPLIFVGAYAAATVLLFPASLLTLGAGYLFGPVKGTALVSASATLGACAAFLVSRYIARPAVEKRLEDFPRLRAAVSGAAADGARLVLLLRLSPLVPFSLLNYLLAASWAGMLPGTFAYVYLGSLGKVAADAAAGGGSSDGSSSFDAVRIGLYVVGAVATLYATKLIGGAAAAAIDRVDDAGEGADSRGDSDGGSSSSS